MPTHKSKIRGRPRVKKRALVNGILQVLVNGVAWRKMAECGCSYVSCFRYLKEVQRRGKLKLIYKMLAKQMTNLENCSIDTTLIPSFEFQALTGWSGKHKQVGTKISLVADEGGLPADCQFGKGSTNDKVFLPDHVRAIKNKKKKVMNLDMGYMNLDFRREMQRIGVRVNMKVRDQDFTRKRGPKFSFDEEKYKARLLLERTNGWIKNFRRLRLRREFHIAMFEAFVFLALIIILIRSG